MSSQAADHDPRGSSAGREELRRASESLRKAQAEYSRFVVTAPLDDRETKAHRMKEMLAAQKELQAAEADFQKIYAQHLQEDPEFRKRSEEVERRVPEGPPWEDGFSPTPLLRESGRRER